MRQAWIALLCAFALTSLGACDRFRADDRADVGRAVKGVNVIDESNLGDIMLTVADPNEAVTYFQRTLKENPDRVDVRRGLAKSLIRAKRTDDAVKAWKLVVEHDKATNDDKVDYADALIRSGEWELAEMELDKIAPTYETYNRYRLEAMVADSNREWEKADAFYETAAGMTTKPAGVLNNWGYSKLTRGDFSEAESLFVDAIRYDETIFTSKNNLALARAAQGQYDLPAFPMTQIERAQLLHTLGLSAVKRGDVEMGKSLLRDAIETHPRHFEAAVRALRALEGY